MPEDSFLAFLGSLLRGLGVVWAALTGVCLVPFFSLGPDFLVSALTSFGIGALLWFVGGLLKGRP